MAGCAVGKLIGRTTYEAFSGFFKSTIWIEQTERHTYKAPDGHEIIADPTYQESGQGRIRILNRDKHSFDYEITALQGNFRVDFTSKERWMHKAANGEFEYPKSIDEYKADIRKDIAQKIEDDRTGTFDVIQFLKEMRDEEPLEIV